MPVYIDPLLPCVPNGAWRWTKSSHLFADTLEELHAFAGRIGMKRAWFQHKPGRLPHYDLTEKRRGKAIALGALEMDRRRAVEKWREIRDGIREQVGS